MARLQGLSLVIACQLFLNGANPLPDEWFDGKHATGNSLVETRCVPFNAHAHASQPIPCDRVSEVGAEGFLKSGDACKKLFFGKMIPHQVLDGCSVEFLKSLRAEQALKQGNL